MSWIRISADEARERSKWCKFHPFCVSVPHAHEIVSDHAWNGNNNCFFSVPESKLHEIKEDLRQHGFKVYSEPINRKEVEGINNNIFEKYPQFPELYELEVTW